ncbi:collagen-binding domain-containing protein [Actinocorallia sp. A-T 12471]|uniref:collagen-binding domain-containing protein n=1 Tax=Actinocorallia sp. A-T 12471 TaxID=3089813 RepID=UPI0029CC78D5|nr:collagen-binding domain-containing protein [Actinocorallia sp. A-T 12471]MDX6743893.1 collagen-binding domain-containing protein [Actinocorallia sp. A-T 12471]
MKITLSVRGAIGIAAAGALAAAVGGIAAGAGAAPGAAPYAPVDPLAGAQGFNVVVAGDARVTSNENEGTLAVGGNLTIGGSYRVGNTGAGGFTFPGDAQPTALVVGGQVDFAGSDPGGVVQVLSNRYVKVGDLSNATVLITDENNASVDTQVVASGEEYNSTPRVELTVQQPVASVGAPTGLDFAALFDQFRSTSDELAECENNVILRDGNGTPLPDQDSVPAGSDIRIELTPGVTNVLNITAENLANIADLTYDPLPSADTPLLVNVDTGGVGDEFTWPVATDDLSGLQAPYILWNLPTATLITMPEGGGDSLEGTLYAPNAHLVDLNSSNIEGDIVVGELTHGSETANGGEFHHFPFAATLDCAATPTPTPTPTTPTPTPTVSPTPPPRGGLTVDKQADRRHTDVGGRITFTITATNATGADVETTLTDDLTDVLEHAELIGTPTASTGTIDYAAPTLTWTGVLGPGESVTITYRVRTTSAGEIRNTVTWPGGSDCLEVWVWNRDHSRPQPDRPHWHHPHGKPHDQGRPCPWNGPKHGGHWHKNHKPHKKPRHWHMSHPRQ